MRTCSILLVLCMAVSATAQTIEACGWVTIENGDWADDETKFSPGIKAAMNEGLIEALGDDASISWGDFMNSNGDLKSMFTIDGIDEDTKDVLLIGISLAGEATIKLFNDSLEAHYEEDPDEKHIGTVIELAPGLCEGEVPPAPETAAHARVAIEGVIEMALNTPSNELCDSFDTEQREYYQVMRNALIGVLGLPANSVSIQGLAIPSCNRRRRLMATGASMEVDYELSDMTIAQGEAVAANMNAEDFDGDLTNELKAKSGADFPLGDAEVTGTSTKFTGDGARFVYDPKKYEPTTDVGTLNGIARVQGDNEPQLGGSGEDLLNWMMGIVLISSPCILCAICNICPMPCIYWCCTKAKYDNKPGLMNGQVLQTLVCLGIGFIGFIVALAGNGTVNGGVGVLSESIDNMAGIVNRANTNFGKVNEGINALVVATNFNAHKCDATNSLHSSVAGFEMENPMGRTGEDFKKELSDIQTEMNTYNDLRSLAATLLALLPFFVICAFTVGILQAKTGKLAGMKSCCKTITCVISPIISVVLIAMWLIAVVNCLLSVVLADVCAKNPVDMLPFPDDIAWFITCEGTPPDMLMNVYDVGRTMDDAGTAVAGLTVFIEKGGETGCSDSKTDDIEAAMSDVSAGVVDLVDMLRCNTLNKIVSDVVYTALCDNMVSGCFQTWVGILMIASTLTWNWFLYRKVSLQVSGQVAKVVPYDENKPVDDQEPLVGQEAPADSGEAGNVEMAAVPAAEISADPAMKVDVSADPPGAAPDDTNGDENV